MKEVRIEVPANQNEIIEDFLELSCIQYSKYELAGNNTLYTLRVEDGISNNLLHELKARGVGVVFGNISIIQLNLYLSSTSPENVVQKSTAANLEEILANIEDSAVLSSTYITLVILSGALAAFGLYSNSVVIIIGSMIVAPLMGPIALTSIGILLPRRGLLKKGLIAEGIGIFATIAVGFIIGLILGQPDVIPDEMADRAEPGSMDIVFAVVSAIAAGVIISKGQSLSIVGVAIAASLAPPAANIGLFLAFGLPNKAELSAILLIINVLAINASCSIMFILFRLPSKSGMSKRRASRAQKMSQIATTIVVLSFIAVSIFLLVYNQ